MFIDKLRKRQEKINSCLGVNLNPSVLRMPPVFSEHAFHIDYSVKQYMWMEWLVDQVAPCTSLFYINDGDYSSMESFYKLIDYLKSSYRDIPFLLYSEYRLEGSPSDYYSKGEEELKRAEKEGIGLAIIDSINYPQWILKQHSHWYTTYNFLFQAQCYSIHDVDLIMKTEHLNKYTKVIKENLWFLILADTSEPMKKTWPGSGPVVIVNSSIAKAKEPALLAKKLAAQMNLS